MMFGQQFFGFGFVAGGGAAGEAACWPGSCISLTYADRTGEYHQVEGRNMQIVGGFPPKANGQFEPAKDD